MLLCFACCFPLSLSPLSLPLSLTISLSQPLLFDVFRFLFIWQCIKQLPVSLFCAYVCVILCIRRLESNTRVKGTRGILYDLHTLESILSCLWRHLSKKLPKALCVCVSVCVSTKGLPGNGRATAAIRNQHRKGFVIGRFHGHCSRPLNPLIRQQLQQATA